MNEHSQLNGGGEKWQPLNTTEVDELEMRTETCSRVTWMDSHEFANKNYVLSV